MPSKIYMQEEATVVFGAEAGDDVAWSTNSVLDGAGQQSAQYDLGLAPRSQDYRVRFYSRLQAGAAINQTLDLYLKTGDDPALHLDNDEGVGDIPLSAVSKLVNLHYIGSIAVDSTGVDIELVSSMYVSIISRYIHFVFQNQSGAETSAALSATKVELTPIPFEGQ